MIPLESVIEDQDPVSKPVATPQVTALPQEGESNQGDPPIPNPKKSLKDFAQLIKSRHPMAYDDLSDDDLARRVIRKYPVYQDMVDLSEITSPIQQAVSPSLQPMSALQKQLQLATQPTSGKVQVGQSAFRTDAGEVPLSIDLFKDMDPAKASDMEFADVVTRGTWGLSIGELGELYTQAGLPVPDLDHLKIVGQYAKQNVAYARANKQPSVSVNQKSSTVMLRQALAEGGIASFNDMAKRLVAEQQRVDDSIHDITPEEVARVEATRKSLSAKIGTYEMLEGGNQYLANLLSMVHWKDPQQVKDTNILPGMADIKQAHGQVLSDPKFQEFLKNQSNMDAVIQIAPGVVSMLGRSIPAMYTGQFALGNALGTGASTMTQLSPIGAAVGSMLGVQADVAIQHFDKPLSEQAAHQLINIAMLGSFTAANVARAGLAARGIYLPRVIEYGSMGGLGAFGTYGGQKILEELGLAPEATFQQTLANTLVGGLIPMAMHRVLKPQQPKPEPAPFQPAGLLGPAPEGGPIQLGETFPIYENRYPDQYKVNLSRPGETPIEFQYAPGEQIPLFDAIIGGQKARAYVAKGLGSLTDSELSEAYILAGGLDHNLPTDRGDLITAILDLHSSKFPLMEATTENKLPVITKWAGIERTDQLMETPFQFGKTYRILEDGKAWWKVEDLDNPGHVYRIGKYEPAGLAANIETVTSPGTYTLERTLVIPDFTGEKLQTQPLLFPEPAAAQPVQGGGPRVGTTDRAGAQARLSTLLDFKNSKEFRNLPSRAKREITEEIVQLRKDILVPSGGRNQLFVPRAQAERHLQNLSGFARRPEFSELPPEYQQLVKQEIADLDFLLNKNPISPDPERQARIYQGITDTSTSSPANLRDRAVNQVGAEGPKLLPPGQYEMPAPAAPPTEPKLQVPFRPDRDFERPPAGEDLGSVPIGEAKREVPQLREDWADYNAQLELYKRTTEYGKLTWQEKQQLEPDTQVVPLPKRLSENQAGRGKRSKVDSQAKERGWTVKVPKEGKGKAFSEMLREKERLLQEQQNTPEPLSQEEPPYQPSALAQELGLPEPSQEARAAIPTGDGSVPVNPGTNLFGVRSLVRELLSRREQKQQAREQLGNLPSLQIPDPENNPLWQMIRQLPVEELRTQLQEEGIDVGLLKSKALLQKALYSRLAPEAEARVVATPEQTRKFEAARLEKARGYEEVYVDAIRKLRAEVGDQSLRVEQVKADPSKYETQLMDANLSPREQEIFGWRDPRNPEQVAQIEQQLLQMTEARVDEPSWITEARNNLKGTTLTALGGQTLYDMALVYAYDHIYKPGMRYAKFAAEVVEQLGEEYGPMVAGLWDHFTAQAAERVGSLGQAMRGVQAKLAVRNQSISDLAARSPESLRAIYDSLGLATPDILPVKGVLDRNIESKQLAMELSHLLSGMKKLGAQTPGQAQKMLGEMRPKDATSKTMGLTAEEALAIKQAEVVKEPVVSFPDLARAAEPEVKIDDLVGAVDRLLVNNRAAEKLAGVKKQSSGPKQPVVLDDRTLNPEDWLRGLDITPEELASRVESLTRANRIVSTDTYLAAKKEIRESLREMNLGVSPKQLRAMSVVMAYEVENGIYNFGKHFSEKAIALFGDAARTNMMELVKDTFRYLRLYRESPVLNRLTQLPGGYQLGKVLDGAHKISFGAVDGFRKWFSLGSRSPQAREIGDLWAMKQSEVARTVDNVKTQLLVVRNWAEGFTYYHKQPQNTGGILNVNNYRMSELNSKKLRMEMNFALDEGTEPQLLARLGVPKDIQNLIGEMRTKLSEMRDEIRKISPTALEEVEDHYFPRLWERPGDISHGTGETSRGGAPFLGSQSFLKGRTVESTRYGVEKLGWKLKNENFVDNFVAKYEEMWKFIKMNETLQYMKKNGMEKVVDRSQLAEMAEFYAPLNDKVSNIVKRVEKSNGDVAYEDSGKVRVYPRMVADLVNSHLSPSLHRYPAFQAWNAFSTFATQFQLVGLFHMALVSADAAVRLPAISVKSVVDAAQHAIHGETKPALGVLKEGAKALATGLFTPVGIGAVVWKGNKMLREWDRPGSQSPEIQQRVRFAQMGGAQARMEGHFQGKAIEGILKNIQNVWEIMADENPEINKIWSVGKEVGKAGGKVPFAVIEAVMRPMLQEFVPRAKLGVQYYLQGYEIARLGSRANAKDVRRVSAKVEAVVSDTLGQMNYGNLHMNKAVKEIMMSTVNALGFQFGAQRTAYMPIHDTVKFLKDAVTPGERADFTHRMAYIAGMAIGLPMMHTIAQVIATKYNTGTAQIPFVDDSGEEALKDFIAFKTGRKDQNGDPERWYIPNLGTKELYPVFGRVLEGRPKAAAEHQLEIFGHKLTSGVRMISEYWHNKDFHGRYIIDPNSTDSTASQLGDFALDQLKPFFFRNKDILEQRGVTGLGKYVTFLGPTPAPQYINASTAEDVMMDILKDAYPKTGKGDKEFERGQLKRKYMNQWKQAVQLGDETVLDVLDEEISKAVDEGAITRADRKAIKKGVDTTRTQNLFARLTQQDPLGALRIYQSWMSPEEQLLVLPELGKLYRRVKNLALSPDAKQRLRDQINDILEAKQKTISELLDEEEAPSTPKEEEK